MSKNIFIGVAWPYVNGNLHIGHLAGYLLPADICARFNRLIGNNVLMISGSDCFGTPITLEADKKGVRPEDIVDKYHENDVDLFLNVLNLSYSLYTKTDHPNHASVVQEVFLAMLAKDLIFIDKTLQFYSPTQNRFLPDRYVIGDCPFCGAKETRSDQCDSCGKLISTTELKNPINTIEKGSVIVKETQHYFIDWPKLEPFLKDYVLKTSGNWKDWVKSETNSWFVEGLLPRPITRDIDWGVAIPDDRIPNELRLEHSGDKRFYVWFDAVIGYLSGSILWADSVLNEPEAWKRFWYGDNLYHYYFMGKDNLVFHTLFWPGQLYAYDSEIHLPDQPNINMFLNLGGEKFSKSRNVMIETRYIVETYGNDTVRFYLTLIMPEYRDASFNWQDFEEKSNGILVGNIGNLIHRVFSIAAKEDLSRLKDYVVDPEIVSKVKETLATVKSDLTDCRFKSYLDELILLSGFGNKLVDSCELWKLKARDEAEFFTQLKNILFVIVSLGLLLEPVTPHGIAKFKAMLGVISVSWNESFTGEVDSILDSLSFNSKPEPLFTKIDVSGELVE